MVSREESRQNVKNRFAHIFATCAWSLRLVGPQIVISFLFLNVSLRRNANFGKIKFETQAYLNPSTTVIYKGRGTPTPGLRRLLVLEFDCWLPHIGLIVLEFYFWPPSVGIRLLAA